MNPTEYARILERNIEDHEWRQRLDTIRPSFDRCCMIARATGSCADAGYSTREWAPTVLTRSGRLVTVAACRFDDPATTIARVLRTAQS